MTEAKVIRYMDGSLDIRCGNIELDVNDLYFDYAGLNQNHTNRFVYYLSDDRLDDLYAVLHAREQAKQWKEAEPLLDKIDKLERT